MKREEAIKMLRGMKAENLNLANLYTKDRYNALDMAIKALEQEPSSSENPNRWIPVSESLPKAGEYVGDVAKYYLVQNEYGDMLVARYTHSDYWEEIYQLKPISDEIVSWMPLPEPYKAESEVEE